MFLRSLIKFIMQATAKRKSILPILLLAALIGAFLIVFWKETVQLFSVIINTAMTNSEKREALSLIFGIKGAAVLSAFSALQIIIPLFPAEPLQVIAGIGYGFIKAFIICMAGVFVGNTVVFLASKIFGNKLQKYIDTHIDIDFSTANAQNKLFLIVFLLYLLPAIPYGMICLLTASVGIKYPKYILFTIIGSVPSVCIGIALGSLTVGVGIYSGLITLILLVAFLILVYKKRDQITAAINKLLTPYSTATKVKKPNSFIYTVAAAVCTVLFGSRIKIKLNNRIKLPKNEACIIIGSHPSFLDWYYAALPFYPKKLNFITARYYFFRRYLAFLLRNAGCMPKSMFSPDFESAKNMISILRNNQYLALLPEAQLSTVGRFESIHQPTIDFIKTVSLPVYAVQLNGAYLAKPKAGKSIRRGAVVEINAKKLFDKDETKNLTSSEVREIIEGTLYFNDFEWLKENPNIHYKCKTLAEGLENILYLCPKCKKEATLTTSKNTISCSCGFSVTLDDRYNFIGDNLPFNNHQEWYDYQFELLQKQAENKDFELSSPVTLRRPSSDGKSTTVKVGTGICRLNKNGLLYSGTQNGEDVELVFPMKNIYRLLFGAGEDFEIYDGSEYYSFMPEEPKLSVKFYIASIILHNQYEALKNSDKVTE